MTYPSTSAGEKWAQMEIIIGGGKYGCAAVEYLRKKRKGFVLIDKNQDCLAIKKYKLKTAFDFDAEGEHFIQGDIATVSQLIARLKPEYVFPTAPVHIAADLAKIKFKLKPWSEAINTILPKLPEVVVLHAGKGKIVVSFNRDHDCIDKCAMPEVCPSSRIRRPCKMTELMHFASPEAFILISYSMELGIGALKGSELVEFFNWAKIREKFIVATACDCHGVLHAFQKQHDKAEE